jgi:hypothetical protein
MLIHQNKNKNQEKETFVDHRVIIKQLNEINYGKNGQKGKLDKKKN